MLAAARGLTLTQLAEKINELQRQVGYTKRPVKRAALYHYSHVQPPIDRAYAIAAILGIHPKKLYQDTYNEEKYEQYRHIYLKSNSD